MNLYQDGINIINQTLKDIDCKENVKEVLRNKKITGKVYLLAIGKAAYDMTKAALEVVKIEKGLVVTKKKHGQDDLKNIIYLEAGHPHMDDNSFLAGKIAKEMFSNLTKEDTMLILISGGGSALFEDCDLKLDELVDINNQLLKSGANIEEINTIRKRLSNLKAGRFAKMVYPAKVINIIVSDVINDSLEMIASGISVQDNTSFMQAQTIINKYHLKLSDKAYQLLKRETPVLKNIIENHIVSNLHKLCTSAQYFSQQLGYDSYILSENKQGYANIVGQELASLANHKYAKPTCFIIGGETVVNVKGTGLGGRNQELVLSAVKELANKDAILFSLGSDGTDGPTNAAGAWCDGKSYLKAKNLNLSIDEYLEDNDSYHFFQKMNQLIITGPTGTNINDLSFILIGEC